MAWWICPNCDRQFGRFQQSHVCVPGMSLDEYYADQPPFHREVAEAVIEHLRSEGDIHVEPVSVGVLIKHGRTIVELRPMKQWLALSFVLPYRVKHPRITRTMKMSGAGGSDAASHVVRVYAVDDIDDQVREWLSAAMLTSD